MTFSDSFELDKLSVQQLKEIIKSANLSFEGCLEKPELLNRAKKAVAVIQDLSKDISSAAVGEGFQNLHTELKLFGSYNCIVAVEKSKSLISKVDGAVIMLHGFQAKNIGLLPFANEFYLHQKTSIAEDKNIIFVFPQAPRGGLLNVSQWWEIDLVKWLNAANGDQAVLAKLLRERPEGLAVARKNLSLLMDQICDKYNLISHENLVLAGFSQGAITVMDVALDRLNSYIADEKSGGPPAGITMLSGAPTVIEEWSAVLKKYTDLVKKMNNNKKYKKLKVFISHGLLDPVLPYVVSGWTKSLLEQTPDVVELQYVSHNEGHSFGCAETKNKIFSFWLDALIGAC